MLLLPFDAGHVIPLRRAPDVQAACTEAIGPRALPLDRFNRVLGLPQRRIA